MKITQHIKTSPIKLPRSGSSLGKFFLCKGKGGGGERQIDEQGQRVQSRLSKEFFVIISGLHTNKLLTVKAALFIFVHQSIKVRVEVIKLFFSKFRDEVRSCHYLGCPNMVGKNYHLFRISFAGDFAHSVYEEARTQWVDENNDMVIEFEFDDQPVVYMKYSAHAKPMIICKAKKAKFGYNYEL
ncbi:hypothetical protein EV2_029115 [Malus domestica]